MKSRSTTGSAYVRRSALATLFVAAIALLLPGTVFAQWQILDYPGAQYTYPRAVSGGVVVGWYNTSSDAHGFIYNGTSFVTADYPGTGGGYSTMPRGIDGHMVVGSFGITGWTFDGRIYNMQSATWETLSSPYSQYPDLSLTGISGNNIAGALWNGNQDTPPGAASGVLYNGTTWSLISPPGAADSGCNGIQGNTIVGSFETGYHTPQQGFIYDGTNYTTVDVPGATSTQLTGISGGNIVGDYTDAAGESHGFLYDGTNFTTLDPAGATSTEFDGIDGSTIVGSYRDSSGAEHGVIYTIPEPSSWALLLMAGACLVLCRFRSR